MYEEMLALTPNCGDSLLNAMILQRLLERIRTTVADKGHLSPQEMVDHAMHVYNSLSRR